MAAPYTQAVVTEVTRKAAVVPAVFRKTLRPVELHGYTIPAGWTIMPHIGVRGRDPTRGARRPLLSKVLSAQIHHASWIDLDSD